MRFAAFAARATKKRSRACALCAFFLRHIFCALELLRNSSIAHKKRRIQPKRYVQYPLTWLTKCQKYLKMNIVQEKGKQEMDAILNFVDIKRCNFEDIKTLVADYYINNRILVDSFWENHVRDSNHYKITIQNEIIGYFSINSGTILVLFNVMEKYRSISQELFTIIKKFESIKEALIPTGDEYFISHAIDNYVKIEKQAYFSIYTDKSPNKVIPIELKLANIEKDMETLNLCHDFLKSEIENINNSIDEEIYIAIHENNVIGFGIIEYQKIIEVFRRKCLQLQKNLNQLRKH